MEKRTMFIFIVCLLVVIGLSGCNEQNKSQSDKEKFIGTWETESIDGVAPDNYTATYTYYENNTVKYVYINYVWDSNITYWKNYSLDDGKICITNGGIQCHDYEFSNNDNRVTLTAEEFPTTILVKVE